MAVNRKPKLVLGNNIAGTSPAVGKMRMFRYGERHLSSYEYDTLDLTKLGGSHEPEHHEVDEVDRFFDRSTDPRMTTGAVVFAPMEEDGEHTNHYFRRPATDDMVTGIEDGYRTWGAQTPEQESVGLSFRLRQMDHDSDAYFDNARFQVSNILWEFSPDGGRSRWYQLYELPNKPRCRITLPNPTNQVRARAVSNNPDEWVQSMAIRPLFDFQNGYASALSWVGDLEGDGFGYVTWPECSGGYGDPVYVISSDWYSPLTPNTVYSEELTMSSDYGISTQSSALMYDETVPMLRPVAFNISIRAYDDTSGELVERFMSQRVLVDAETLAVGDDVAFSRSDGTQLVTVYNDDASLSMSIQLVPATVSASQTQGLYEFTPDYLYCDFGGDFLTTGVTLDCSYSVEVFEGGVNEGPTGIVEVLRTRSTSFAPDDSEMYAEMLRNSGATSSNLYIKVVDASSGSVSKTYDTNDYNTMFFLGTAYRVFDNSSPAVEVPSGTPLRIGYTLYLTASVSNASRIDFLDAEVDSSVVPFSSSPYELGTVESNEIKSVSSSSGYIVSAADMYNQDSRSISNTVVASATASSSLQSLSKSGTASFALSDPLVASPLAYKVLEGGSYVNWDGLTPVVEGDSVKVLIPIENTSGDSIGTVMVQKITPNGFPQVSTISSFSDFAKDRSEVVENTVTVTGKASYMGELYGVLAYIRPGYRYDSSYSYVYLDMQQVTIPILAPSVSLSSFSPCVEESLARGYINWNFSVADSGDYSGYYVNGTERNGTLTNARFALVQQVRESFPFNGTIVESSVQALITVSRRNNPNSFTTDMSVKYVAWMEDRVRFRLSYSGTSLPAIEMDLDVFSNGEGQNHVIEPGDMVVYITKAEVDEWLSDTEFADIAGIGFSNNRSIDCCYYDGPEISSGSMVFSLPMTAAGNTGGADLNVPEFSYFVNDRNSADDAYMFFDLDDTEIPGRTIPIGGSYTLADSDIVASDYPPSVPLDGGFISSEVEYSGTLSRCIRYETFVQAAVDAHLLTYSSASVSSRGQFVHVVKHHYTTPAVHTAHVSVTNGGNDPYSYVQVNGSGTRHRTDSSTFAFSDGDFLRFYVDGSRGGGTMYVDGTRVRNSLDPITYDYVPSSGVGDVWIKFAPSVSGTATLLTWPEVVAAVY